MRSFKRPSSWNAMLSLSSFAAACVSLIFSAAPVSAATNYPDLILSDHPVAYYRLEELPGSTTAFDSTTNGFNGLINYATQSDGVTVYPQLGLPGIDTNSLAFAIATGPFGQGDVDIPVNSTINPTPDGTNGAPFSAELWVRATTQPANYSVPLDDSSDFNQPPPFGSGSAGWNIYQTIGPASTWSYSIRPSGFPGNGPPVTLLQWTHLVLTYSNSVATFYVNGVAARTDGVSTFYVNNGSSDLLIGQGPATGWIPFAGNIDEVAIYNYPLSAAQVAAHYQLGTNSIRAIPTPPSFLSEPASASAYSGTPVRFSAGADGTAPLHYQWLRGSTPIAGATSSTYTFTCHYPADDQATFSVMVTNSVGVTNSAPATLTVLTNLNMEHDPFSIARRVGSWAAFRVVANGAVPITYQWYQIGTNSVTNAIAHATNDTLWLSNVQLTNDQSAYYAHVTGPFVSADSNPATLSVTNRTVTVPITGYARFVVADNPVAYLRLDEQGTNTTATDAVGSFDGAYSGDPLILGYPTGIPHEPDLAIHVTNTAIVTIPYALELNPVTGPWSAEIWLQPTSQDTANFHTPFSSLWNSDFGVHIYGWNLYQHPASAWTFNGFSGGASGSFNSDFRDIPLIINSWYHIVISDDLTTIRMYVNTNLVVAVPRAGIGFIPNGINGDPGVGGGPTTLGTRSDGAFGDWDGGIDEVAFYNYALSPQQIQLHFLNTTKLVATQSANTLTLTWGGGTLQSATSVTGPYTNVLGATSPYTTTTTGPQRYFRVQVY